MIQSGSFSYLFIYLFIYSTYVSRIKEMIANIDIAPSFLDIAGVSTPRDMDGVSIMKLFRKSKDGRRYKK